MGDIDHNEVRYLQICNRTSQSKLIKFRGCTTFIVPRIQLDPHGLTV